MFSGQSSWMVLELVNETEEDWEGRVEHIGPDGVTRWEDGLSVCAGATTFVKLRPAPLIARVVCHKDTGTLQSLRP